MGHFLADVSGHWPLPPSLMKMAITHSIAHTHPGLPTPPGNVLSYLNHHLTTWYTAANGTFVTAFYGIRSAGLRLTYAWATLATIRRG